MQKRRKRGLLVKGLGLSCAAVRVYVAFPKAPLSWVLPSAPPTPSPRSPVAICVVAWLLGGLADEDHVLTSCRRASEKRQARVQAMMQIFACGGRAQGDQTIIAEMVKQLCSLWGHSRRRCWHLLGGFWAAVDDEPRRESCD